MKVVKFNEKNIDSLKKDELKELDGGGPTWEFLGEVTGIVKNSVMGVYEYLSNANCDITTIKQ